MDKAQTRRNYKLIQMSKFAFETDLNSQRKLKENLDRSELKLAAAKYERKLTGYRLHQLASTMTMRNAHETGNIQPAFRKKQSLQSSDTNSKLSHFPAQFKHPDSSLDDSGISLDTNSSDCTAENQPPKIMSRRKRATSAKLDLHSITLADILDDKSSTVAETVKIRQAWIGDPEAINSIRRPILSAHERNLKKMVKYIIIERQQQTSVTPNANSNSATQQLASGHKSAAYQPPYPVHFNDVDQETVGEIKCDAHRLQKHVKSRPFSAPVLRNRTQEVITALDFTNGVKVEIQNTRGSTMKSSSMTPSSKVWSTGQRLDHARIASSNAATAAPVKRKPLLHRLTQPTISSQHKRRVRIRTESVDSTKP